MYVDDATTLTVSIAPEDADNKAITWSSDNTSVATVSDGVVTAVGVGTATITAKAEDGSGVQASCIVTVEARIINVSSITLNLTSYQLDKGESVQLEATVSPSDATDKAIVWSSSDESVVTVDSTGKVTFVGVGYATVTATAADGSGASAECTFSAIDGIESIINERAVEVIMLDGIRAGQSGKGIQILRTNGKTQKVYIK